MRAGRAGAAAPWTWSFLLLGCIWGCSFWWIELGLRSLIPVEVALTRLALGAATLLVLCAATRTPLPRGRSTWRHLVVVALLSTSVPFTLFAFGQTRIPSLLAGILNATTPLATLVVSMLAFPEERPTAERVRGLALGFLGVLIVLGAWRGIAGGTLTGVLACLGAVTCYGVAFPYVRRHLTPTGIPPLSLAAGQVVLGTAALVPLVAAVELLGGPAERDPLELGAVLGLAGLGVLGSGVAYVLNFRVIAAAGAATASAVTYLTPLVAVVVGAAFLDEAVRWHHPVGTAVVLLGVALGQGRLRPRVARASLPSP